MASDAQAEEKMSMENNMNLLMRAIFSLLLIFYSLYSCHF